MREPIHNELTPGPGSYDTPMDLGMKSKEPAYVHDRA